MKTHGITIQLTKLNTDNASNQAGNCGRTDAFSHLNDAWMIEEIERPLDEQECHVHRNAIFTLATLRIN